MGKIFAKGENAKEQLPNQDKIRNFNPAMQYRKVGKTDEYVSALSLGSGKVELEVLNKGIELGINMIHTSSRYSKGRSIATVAKAIKGRREKLYLAVKDNFESIEQALKILETDYIDFLMFNRHNPDELRNELPEIKKKFLEWKDKGLVKYAGVTTHKRMDECINITAKAGFFSCVMPTFSPKQFHDFKVQKDLCRENKVSIFAMKVKGELEGKDFEKQIGLVLSEPAVCTIIKAIMSFDDLTEWSKAAALVKTGFWLRKENYRKASNASEAGLLDYKGCSLCGTCEKVCPHDVATADIIRCIRYYHDAQKMPEVARQEFFELNGPQSILSCTQCGTCEKYCPQQIAVRKEINRAKEKWLS